MIGQNGAQEALAAYLRGGRLSHAILLEGAGAQQRRQAAILTAKALLCAKKDPPCGICKDCVKLESGNHPDLLIYRRQEGPYSLLHMEDLRALRQEVYIKPGEGRHKVFLLEEMQEMTIPTQNALLKVLEEPPGMACFILTCENKAALLPTLISRLTVFTLGEPPQQDYPQAAKILEQLCFGSELTALAALFSLEKDRKLLNDIFAQMAAVVHGGMRRANPQAPLERLSLLRLSSILAIIEQTAAVTAQNGNRALLITNFCAACRRQLDTAAGG